jgi:Zn-finger nucleic acid-binding protein
MRQYERNGVTIDQCTECRGIFLDRGELERLVDAETAYHAPPAAAPTGRPAPGPDYRYERRDHDRDYDRREHYGREDYGHGHHGRKKKRESFLEGLFD